MVEKLNEGSFIYKPFLSFRIYRFLFIDYILRFSGNVSLKVTDCNIHQTFTSLDGCPGNVRSDVAVLCSK